MVAAVSFVPIAKAAALGASLENRGFAVASAGALSKGIGEGAKAVGAVGAERWGVDFAALAATMGALTAAGWPPVFIFLYDQVVLILVATLESSMRHVCIFIFPL